MKNFPSLAVRPFARSPRPALRLLAGLLAVLALGPSVPGAGQDVAPGVGPDPLTRFSPQGVRITGETERERWSFGLSLVAWGRGADLVSVPAAPGVASSESDTRHEIRRGTLTEWYVEDEHGTEQGFTLAAPPATSASGSLRLVLAVTGGFAGEVLDDERGACFTSPDGTTIVHYRGLRAWDAAGRELDARMAFADGELALLVEDQGACYPLTIDPWIWTQRAVLVVDERRWLDQRFGGSVDIEGDTALIGTRGYLPGPDFVRIAHVYTRSGTVWTKEAELATSTGKAGDWFGFCVLLEGDTAVIGAPHDDDRGERAGAVYVFTRSGTTWTERAKLTAGDGEADDLFGAAVALDGDTLLVGAGDDDDMASGAGAAYVFRGAGALWSLEAKLTAADGEEYDRFGASVAIDGDTVLVGAPRDDTWAPDWGSAYIFTRAGTTWTQVHKGTPANGARYAWFGKSVALEGDTALIGSPYDNEPGISWGAAHVWTRSGTAWSETAKLTVSGGLYDEVGWSVDLDGDTALLGADQYAKKGRAYVFLRGTAGWSHVGTISDAVRSGDRFGASVALDAGTALIGAPGGDFGLSIDAGSAYVFTGGGASWTRQTQLAVASTVNATGHHFGGDVDVDGDTALLGARGDGANGSQAGAAYIYSRVGELWTRGATLRADDGAANDRFGVGVALDGDTALIGARGDDDLGSAAGAAYVFARSGTAWAQQEKLLAPDGEPDDGFGFCVALDGTTAILGAPGEGDGGLETGAAYVFTRTGTSWAMQAKLVAADSVPRMGFGTSVALHLDTAVIGVGDGGGERAYVFTRSGSTWTQQAKLTAADSGIFRRFGWSVAVDGDTAVIGSWADTDLGQKAGAVYVFARSGSTWTQQAKLHAPDGAGGDEFGRSVALDGNLAVVGASSDGPGSAHVFTRSGTAWTARERLATAAWGWGRSFFGLAVTLDGSTIVVGAPGYDDQKWEDAGAVCIFRGTAVAHALFRTAGTNPASHDALTTPVLGTTYSAAVDLAGTTGHSLAWLVGYASPTTLLLGNGQALLVNPADPSGELLLQPMLPGPVATFDLPIPSDLTFVGYELFTQALHLGGAPGVALSNAQDLFLGQ